MPDHLILVNPWIIYSFSLFNIMSKPSNEHNAGFNHLVIFRALLPEPIHEIILANKKVMFWFNPRHLCLTRKFEVLTL